MREPILACTLGPKGGPHEEVEFPFVPTEQVNRMFEWLNRPPIYGKFAVRDGGKPSEHAGADSFDWAIPSIFSEKQLDAITRAKCMLWCDGIRNVRSIFPGTDPDTTPEQIVAAIKAIGSGEYTTEDRANG